MRVAFIDGQVIMWPKGNTFDDAIMIGEQEGGLYKLKGQPDQALVHDTVEPNELWHRRLAHVHYRALPLARKVVEGLPEIQAKHEGVCKGCVKGKNTKNKFPSSESKEKMNLGNHPLRCMWTNVIKITKQVCVLCFFY